MSKPSTPPSENAVDLTNENTQTNNINNHVTNSDPPNNIKRRCPIEYIEDDILDVEQQIIVLKKKKKALETELIEAREELKVKRLKKKLKQYTTDE
ncbi:2187_t:CDS:2 [Cetraspora pellucida]|uniref:2187_t:CDS:1 n=1 Tax=Cetraspora pellucida TaxID=1433469 RepID=A0ACA9LPW1_9GLOM|nr:2187_t:CDS:2 [Cetraspora pellucida]